MRFKDIGSTGLRQYGGWVREEFLPQLVGRQAARVYREMGDNSSVVGAIIFAIVQTMREVDWRTEAPDDTPEAQKMAEFADGLRHDMSHTWEDFLTEALSMIQYGFAPHEIVYKRRMGKVMHNSATSDPGRGSSKFNDGLIGWRRLPIRGQDTVIKWFFDDDGQTKGMTQQPYIGSLIDLPIEKMLLFRPSMHKNNPEGRSALRTAYRPYYFIKRLEEQQAIMAERFGGLPVVYVPNELLTAAAAGDPKASATYAALKEIVTNIRVDEQMGMILPSDTYMGPNGPSNVAMYKFELVTPGGGSGGGRIGQTTETSIERYKLEILTTVLADFLMLGHSTRGTQNLALSKVDMFYSAIQGWLDNIGGVTNRYGLTRIWELNALDPKLQPQYTPDMPQRVDLDAFGKFIFNLSVAGMPLFPDAELENYVRESAGMPDISEEKSKELYDLALAAKQDGQDGGPDAGRADEGGSSMTADAGTKKSPARAIKKSEPRLNLERMIGASVLRRLQKQRRMAFPQKIGE